MKLRIIQAYQQAPWRVQIIWIGRLLIFLVAAAIITGLYLSISAQTAEDNVAIQTGDRRISELRLEIADLQNQLAVLLSSAEMEKRAIELNFTIYDNSNTLYIVVPGYSSSQTIMIAPPPAPDRISSPIIKPSYNQSLWEWFLQSALVKNENEGDFQ